jgi:hypothetical protein
MLRQFFLGDDDPFFFLSQSRKAAKKDSKKALRLRGFARTDSKIADGENLPHSVFSCREVLHIHVSSSSVDQILLFPEVYRNYL